MATTYVPVPFPAWSCRNGTRMAGGAGLGDGRRTGGGELGGAATLVGGEGSPGCSGTETPPVSLKMVGYEVLHKRSKFTVRTDIYSAELLGSVYL